MKISKSFLATIMAVGFLAFTACSDDDDEPGYNQVTPGTVNPAQVFTNGMPTQVGDMTITKDADGKVSKIVEDAGTSYETTYTFNYNGSQARAIPSSYDMTITVTEKDGDDNWVFYVSLNESGFARYAYQDYGDGDFDEWWFEYNQNGQLSRLKRSEGDNEVTTITYDNSGDITKVSVSDDDGLDQTTAISYTNSTVTSPIANKGSIMLFDELFDIDMDEFGPAYYASLLGKATTHLPVASSNVEYGYSDNYASDYTFKWTINDNGFPASLVIGYGDCYYEQPIFFNWF